MIFEDYLVPEKVVIISNLVPRRKTIILFLFYIPQTSLRFRLFQLILVVIDISVMFLKIEYFCDVLGTFRFAGERDNGKHCKQSFAESCC